MIGRAADDLSSATNLEFSVGTDSLGAFKALAKTAVLGTNLKPRLVIGEAKLVPPAAGPSAGIDDAPEPYLTLNKSADLVLSVETISNEVEDGALTRVLSWKGNVRIPLSLDTYKLSLPAPAWFGKENFALTLADDGSITKVEYGEVNGTADLLTAMTAIAQSQQPQTSEQKAAVAQGKADLIYQQQRLVVCQTNPKGCPSK